MGLAVAWGISKEKTMQDRLTRYLGTREVILDCTLATLERKQAKNEPINVRCGDLYITCLANSLTETPQNVCGGFWR